MTACDAFRQLMEPFADGELDVHQHVDAASHFSRCPECKRRIENLVRMKDSLRRSWTSETAPLDLRDRVMNALSAAARQPANVDASLKSAAPHPSEVADTAFADVDNAFEFTLPRRTRPALRGVSIRAVAVVACAAVAAVVLAGWAWLPPKRQLPTLVTSVPARAVSGIRDRHSQCVSDRFLNHQRADFPTAVPEIESRLSRELHLHVVAPDLSDRGFELVGADICDVYGFPAAHVMYQRRQTPPTLLSVFTLQRSERLYSSVRDRPGSREYFVSDGGPTTVVAWNEGHHTYALCADAPRDELLLLVADVRTAGLPPHRRWDAAIALAAWE